MVSKRRTGGGARFNGARLDGSNHGRHRDGVSGCLANTSGPDVTTTPNANSGVHLVIDQFIRINPGGVLPLAVGMPVALSALLFGVLPRRKKLIDSPL